jgi:hypothetical protein
LNPLPSYYDPTKDQSAKYGWSTFAEEWAYQQTGEFKQKQLRWSNYMAILILMFAAVFVILKYYDLIDPTLLGAV